MSKITCHSIEQFLLVCAGLAREGIIFRADAEDLVVVLTGGF